MCKILTPFFAGYDVNGDNEIYFDEFWMIFKDVHENLSRGTQDKMSANTCVIVLCIFSLGSDGFERK